MDFKQYLQEQMTKHPSMQPRDIIKMCYQAARGAEHLLSDFEAAKRYFEREFETTAPAEGALMENISDDICRVNLGVWKAKGLPGEWLLRIFLDSASTPYGGEELLKEYLQEAMQTVPSAREDLQVYLESEMPAVHHSEIYRENEHPAYRIVRRQSLRILPVLMEILQKGAGIIAIDGRAASGKSTMGKLLAQILDAPLIQMDDFFVPPVLRSEERFKEPGSNVHYERFIEEVLPYINEGIFEYRIFDCSIMDYNGKKKIEKAPWRIVEGSYSHHPRFGEYADIKVYAYVDSEEQMQRIRERNGETMAEMFRTRWIPMEEAYFDAYAIKENADIIV